MNRRFFLRLLGIAPLVPIAARLPVVIERKPNPNLIYTFRGFKFVRTQLLVGKDPAIAFTDKLESEGKLAFEERIDVLPGRAHCVQVHHSRPGTDADKMIDRVTWIDESDYSEAMLEKTRQQTRIAGRRYWAQQARIQRKLALVRTRAIA